MSARRFDGMIARATHASTPIEEARTALRGAEAVARTTPDIPRATERIEAATRIIAIRTVGEAAGASVDRIAATLVELGRVASDSFTIITRERYRYAREYAADQGDGVASEVHGG